MSLFLSIYDAAFIGLQDISRINWTTYVLFLPVKYSPCDPLSIENDRIRRKKHYQKRKEDYKKQRINLTTYILSLPFKDSHHDPFKYWQRLNNTGKKKTASNSQLSRGTFSTPVVIWPFLFMMNLRTPLIRTQLIFFWDLRNSWERTPSYT